jgi:hypothetical protein
MKSNRLDDADIEKHEESLKATMVDRKNPDAPFASLMKAVEAKSIIQAGTTVNMLIATGITLPKINYPVSPIEPKELTIQGTWKNQFQEKAKAAHDASVFGNLMVIHGDSFFIGPYAIALTETPLADSVLFRQETEERGITFVKQKKLKPVKAPLVAEARLAQQVESNMFFDKLRSLFSINYLQHYLQNFSLLF